MFRLIACAFVPSLKLKSPPTLRDLAPTPIVCVALVVHSPAIFPALTRDPPVPMVKVVAWTLANERLLTVTAELMVGWLTKLVFPNTTTSLVPGGVLALPATTSQFPAVSQAVLIDPIQATIFGLSETVHRPVMSVSALCSAQLLAVFLAVTPESVQGGSKRNSCSADSMFPFSSLSS